MGAGPRPCAPTASAAARPRNPIPPRCCCCCCCCSSCCPARCSPRRSPPALQKGSSLLPPPQKWEHSQEGRNGANACSVCVRLGPWQPQQGALCVGVESCYPGGARTAAMASRPAPADPPAETRLHRSVGALEILRDPPSQRSITHRVPLTGPQYPTGPPADWREPELHLLRLRHAQS